MGEGPIHVGDLVSVIGFGDRLTEEPDAHDLVGGLHAGLAGRLAADFGGPPVGAVQGLAGQRVGHRLVEGTGTEPPAGRVEGTPRLVADLAVDGQPPTLLERPDGHLSLLIELSPGAELPHRRQQLQTAQDRAQNARQSMAAPGDTVDFATAISRGAERRVENDASASLQGFLRMCDGGFHRLRSIFAKEFERIEIDADKTGCGCGADLAFGRR